jgi:tetratricopeptide (TPR) repeat protein
MNLTMKLAPICRAVTAAAFALSALAACSGPSLSAQLDAAFAQLESGRYADAEQGFSRVLQKDPQNAEALAGLGSALVEQARCKPAVDALRKAVAADATDAVAWTNLGYCQASLDDIPAAIEAYQRAATLEPGDDALWRSIEMLMEDSRDFAGLLKIRTRIAERDNHGPQTSLALGEAYCLYGEFAHCEKLARDLIARTSRNADAQVLLGVALQGQGRTPDALRTLRAALLVQKDHREAWVRLITTLQQAGMKREAEAAIAQAQEFGITLP